MKIILNGTGGPSVRVIRSGRRASRENSKKTI